MTITTGSATDPRPLAGPPLVATYRLQLDAGFGFAAAAARVPYLRRLGVSHLYLSPVLTARPGSGHGYDVVDPRHASPALGGEAGFDALAATVAAHGMGLLLDIVPNHMGIGPANPYWDDVLACGRESPYAQWFDVAWEHLVRSGRRQLVLPVLGEPLEQVLARDELRVVLEDGGLRVRYYEQSFPLDPRTAHRCFFFEHRYRFPEGARDEATEVGLLRDALAAEGGASIARGDAERAVRALAERAARVPAIGAYVGWALAEFSRGEAGRYRLGALLDLQHWRLTHWRRAWRELNYRRFFDITDLVGLRAEVPGVFDATHAWVLDRVARGQVHGVRVDHVDGLRDPLGYLRRLRAALDARSPERRVPVFVEKILTPGEQLDPAWPVDGTTGYEALNDLEAVFIAPEGMRTIEAAYRRLLRLPAEGGGFAEQAIRGKELVLRTAFRPEIRRCVRALLRVCRATRAGFDAPTLADAVLRIAAALPVYRSYVREARHVEPDGRSPGTTHVDTPPGGGARVDVERRGPLVVGASDRDVVARALERAVARAADREAPLRWVAAVLVGDVVPDEEPARRALAEFVLRFQQTSGPATAKGVEDTALYRWYPLAALNEVGGEPERHLDAAVETLHAACATRAARWPHALVAVSTHDTKRSADARARLDALGSLAGPWTALVRRWRRDHALLRLPVGGADGRRAPDANTEYLVYQTILALWPVAHEAPDTPGREADAGLIARVGDYLRKAMREAKVQTTWTDQDAAWEDGVLAFVRALLVGPERARFRRQMAALARRAARGARWTVLSRTLLQLAGPGTPDVYQGDELLTLALVDPDNRRPVDWAARSALLDRLDALPPDGTARLLAGREAATLGKPALLRALLAARRARPALFGRGDYLPLPVEGACAAHLVAFARTEGDAVAVALAPRVVLGVRADGGAPAGGVWADTVVRLPAGWAGRPLVGVLDGSEWTVPDDGCLAVGGVLARLPVALLWSP